MTSNLGIKKVTVRRYLWLSRLIAIIASVNLGLVFFDLSYIPWRDLYLQFIPSITQLYDPVKGIEPHRETQRYLNSVNKLEKQVMQTGLESSEVESLLSELRSLSNQMIADNPFALANKSGYLEKIKNKMRDRIGKESAREAFGQFWSQAYLSQAGWQKEVKFFNNHTRPLMQSNYYRHIGMNGKFVDKFWLIDLPFVLLFGLDFLVRTFFITRINPQLNWFSAMLRRWYDVFLLLPFWRWLRIISVTIRLHQADLINLEPIRQQINHDFVANFAEELTEVVGVRMISQMQESIQRGDVTRWLFHPENRPYVDINNTNELQAIASRVLKLSIYDVLPQIQPDIEALVGYIIESTFNQSPVYQQLHNLPGLSNLRTQLTNNLAKDLSVTAYKTLTATIEDPVVVELAERLVGNFQKALELELKKKQHQTEIQSLLVDMLEEIKINYVKGIAEGGVEKILSESEQIRQIVQ
ncbi:hypothetical protein [Argonema galeatum]|uniref:hypothetical protein n=1 Tax=Argonema galeatum TaxID=2942762 RepID=UPI002010E576|nr:hypothetical protein [Argonema galeatum]MCL1465992.1 hypothetical protein [Argonema galeatum A003/A1]